MPDNPVNAIQRDAPTAEEIVRRAAQLGFDPLRVATALGVEVDLDRPDTSERTADGQ